MNKEVANLWIEALRSGKYKQGTGSLQSLDKYCCLGVLCDICPYPINRNWDNKEISGKSLITQYNVKNWSGIGSLNGKYYDSQNSCVNLATDNDSGSTFSEIADIIEKNWEKL